METREEQKIRKFLQEIGSTRRIATFTPDTFTQPIKVVSCMASKDGGSVAFGNVETLNHSTINFETIEWKHEKKFKSGTEALFFFEEVVKKIEADPNAVWTGQAFMEFAKEVVA